jgi:uncharacterized membrane protein
MAKISLKQGYFSPLVLGVFHAIGILGLLTPYRTTLLSFTPFHLLLCFFLLVLALKKYDAGFFAYLFFSFLVGFSAEWVGVHTGYLFGSYSYGSVLGFKLDQIPLMIGINWFILSYCVGNLLMRIKQNVWLTIILGALVLTGFDYLMEPVAIRFGFWTWTGGVIPWTNYLGWFLLSLLLQWANFNWNKSNNPLAAWLLVYQLLYFAILNYFKL